MPRRLSLSLIVVLISLSTWAGLAEGGKKKGPGMLTIDTTPWSQVRVDGKRIGRTPIRRHSLRAGAHRIELHNPVVGLKRTLELIVHPGKETRLEIDLQH